MLNINFNQTSLMNQRPGLGCGCSMMNQGQNNMMGSMGMMLTAMMGMMATMMSHMMGQGGAPMSMMPGQFGGGGQGGGFPGGSPLNSFLGGGGPQGMNPGGGGSGGGAQSVGGGEAAYSGPAGSVGNVNVEKLVNAVSPSYRKAARQSWPAIVAEANKQGVTNKAQLAYILATTVHESGAGAHMEEFASGRAYEGRRDLGNTNAGDGVRYKGRGFVQITGRTNYQNWSKKLGIDLVGNPDLAKNPATAAKILVGGMREGSFTGKKLSDYINGSKTDFAGARRIVNGTDKASTFANTAQQILRAMG